MKNDPKVMIIGLDAAAWTLVRRPERTALAATADKESGKAEEGLQALGHVQ